MEGARAEVGAGAGTVAPVGAGRERATINVWPERGKRRRKSRARTGQARRVTQHSTKGLDGGARSSRRGRAGKSRAGAGARGGLVGFSVVSANLV